MYSEQGDETLYLASASPRRSELLTQIGVKHQQFACSIDESVQAGEGAVEYVERVTRAKALAGQRHAPDGAVVLAADTAVVIDDRILGKPVDSEDAAAMLRALSGRTHRVMTAIAVASGERIEVVRVDADVSFRPIMEHEIKDYWSTGEPADKAGGYAIQGLGAIFVAMIQGSYSAVVGLPLAETERLLSSFGVGCWQEHRANSLPGTTQA